MTRKSLPFNKTKIICTIGPASQTTEVLRAMIHAGMNVARLNFAHADFEYHSRMIKNIRTTAHNEGKQIAIMADLPGPKLRIGGLEKEPVRLEKGKAFILQTDEIKGNSERVSVNFDCLPDIVAAGDRIFLNDGFIQLEVKKIIGQEVHCKVVVGEELRSFNGINLPGIDLGIPVFTELDRKCLAFARDQRLDAVSQSFVQEAANIHEVREAAIGMDYKPFIIAKIERVQAVKNLIEILEAADGIMVARGDLGVELPVEDIAITQKHLIQMANVFGKPVITATHMLESMVKHNRPTRAEATDVANAILDGTDCIMLSGETAMGAYPVEAVSVMSRIARAIEPLVQNQRVAEMLQEAQAGGDKNIDDLISLTIFSSIQSLKPVAIMSPTLSGGTPRRISRFRPPAWIIAVSPNEQTCQNLQFSYGVEPVYESKKPDNWELYMRSCLSEFDISEGLALLTQGATVGKTGGTNKLEMIDLGGSPESASIW